MSQPRDPTQASATRPHEHPDELLAAYVDGSVSAAEAAQAEAHLSACARCRGEIDIARRALDALKALPELDSPWAGGGSPAAVSREPIAGISTAAAPVRSLAEHRNRNRNRAVAVGLAAAASLLVGILVLTHLGGSGSSTTAALPGQATGVAPDMSKSQINDIASKLARGTSVPQFGAAPSGAGSTSAGTKEAATQGPSIAADAARGVPCARGASGQPADATAVYAQAASFEGKPVWIVGFLSTSGGSSAVEVVAVTTKGCSIVYLAWQPLGSAP